MVQQHLLPLPPLPVPLHDVHSPIYMDMNNFYEPIRTCLAGLVMAANTTTSQHLASPPIRHSVPPYSFVSMTGHRMASVFFHSTAVVAGTTTSTAAAAVTQQHLQQPMETIDFTYVNVWETDADDVDIFVPQNASPMNPWMNMNLASTSSPSLLDPTALQNPSLPCCLRIFSMADS